MTPPITIVKQSQNENTDNFDSLNEARRSCIITTFTSPKSEFNLIEHEQYYSNPNILQKPIEIIEEKPEVQNDLMPIDLTKPKESNDDRMKTFLHRSNSVPIHLYSAISSEPKTPIQTLDQAGVLTSLVSIMDKIELKSSNNNLPVQIDESKLLQQYLTEKALQDSKIKRSQMIKANKTNDNVMLLSSSSTSIMTTSSYACSVSSSTINSSMISSFATPIELVVTSAENVSNINPLRDNLLTPLISNSLEIDVSNDITINRNENSHSLGTKDDIKNDLTVSYMDTLAEIAASSAKLDIATPNTPSSSIITHIHVLPSNKSNSIPPNDSAKNVASEYLKLALNTAKRLKVSSMEDDDMSESDHDDTNKLNSKMVRSVVVGEGSFRKSQSIDSAQTPYIPRYPKDGPYVCTVCTKSFHKESHLVLHNNIHVMEKQFRCEPCGISFRTKGHLQKHERSNQHDNKVSMTTTFGVVTDTNPRPFKCSDCDIAFRIHGHLAKHLRSKTHVQKLECTGKLPFGMCAEIERAGISLTDIDTKDCDNSLASLLVLAKKMHEKDPSKFSNWQPDSNNINSKLVMATTSSNSANTINNPIVKSNTRDAIPSDSDDSDEPNDENNISNNDKFNRDSAFSSDSSTGSIKRKIDAITGSLDPILIEEENNDNKRLKL